MNKDENIVAKGEIAHGSQDVALAVSLTMHAGIIPVYIVRVIIINFLHNEIQCVHHIKQGTKHN